MFCGKCGSKIDDIVKYCPKCGAPVLNSNSEKNTDRKEQNQSKKKLFLALTVVIFTVALLIVLKTGGPEKVAIKSCKTTLSGNMKAYYKLLAQPYKDYMVGSQGWYRTAEDFQEDLASMAEDWQREIAAECGNNYKLNFEVTNVEKADKEVLKSVKSELKNYYYYDADKIKAAAVVTISISASGSEGIGYWTSEVSCVKIGGSWYVHRPGIGCMS